MSMYRCKFLAHGLYINYDCFRHCHLSIHSPDERDNNFIIPYNGEKNKIDWDYVFNLKKELVLKLRNGEFPAFCRGKDGEMCHWIEEYDETPEQDKYASDLDKYIDMIWIGHSNRCNACCVYCFSYEAIKNKKTVKGYDILPLFKELVDKKIVNVDKEPDSHISFAMGEPTILKNFDNIIDLFAKNGIIHFAIYTNGIQLSKTLMRLMSHEKINIRMVISLDSGSREVFKKVKLVDKFNDVCKNIKLYAQEAEKSRPNALGVKYIIIPDINDTKEEIDKWFELCVYKLGVKFLIADIEEHWFVKKHGQVPEYIKDLLRYIKQRCEKENIAFEYYDRAYVLNL